jgi:putative molybdopterin biosynthesis protein
MKRRHTGHVAHARSASIYGDVYTRHIVMNTRPSKMTAPRLKNLLGARRRMRGLTQLALAERVGVTRQSIVNIESGRFVPSTSVALKLARVFECRVEDLFALDEVKAPITAHLVPALAGSEEVAFRRGHDRANRHTAESARIPESRRVVVGFVAGRWVAHRLYGEDALKIVADGFMRAAFTGTKAKTAQIEPLRAEAAARENLILAGCDPALPILATWLRESLPAVRLNCLHAPSRQALEALARGLTHLAGTHLLDAASGEYNVPFVRRLFAKAGAIVVNLGRWEEGFVLLPGNPLGIRSAADLARPRVRLIQREHGARRLRLDWASCPWRRSARTSFSATSCATTRAWVVSSIRCAAPPSGGS